MIKLILAEKKILEDLMKQNKLVLIPSYNHKDIVAY